MREISGTAAFKSQLRLLVSASESCMLSNYGSAIARRLNLVIYVLLRHYLDLNHSINLALRRTLISIFVNK